MVLILSDCLILLFRKKGNPLFYCSGLSVASVFAYSIFLDDHNYRYLLPITGYTILSFFILINSVQVKQVVLYGVTIGFIVVGTFAMLHFYDYKYDNINRYQLNETVKYAEANNIRYAFSGNMLQWQLIFYSNERILCRWKKKTDRYQEYVDKVNKAYAEWPDSCALIAFSWENWNDMKDAGGINLNNGYCILPHPDKKLLEKIGYDLSK